MGAKKVETAVNAMRHSLTGLLIEGQTVTARKQGEKSETLTVRLEDRLNRARESREQMINKIRNEHLKFQTELRSTVTSLHASQTQIFGKNARG